MTVSAADPASPLEPPTGSSIPSSNAPEGAAEGPAGTAAQVQATASEGIGDDNARVERSPMSPLRAEPGLVPGREATSGNIQSVGAGPPELGTRSAAPQVDIRATTNLGTIIG